MWSGVLLVIFTFIVMFVSATVGVNKQSHIPSYQPKNIAFSIWSIIFLSLIISGVYSIIKHNNIYSNTFTCASLLCCSLWLVFQLRKESPLILYLASILAFIGVVFSENIPVVIGPALLCGWLIVASSLSTMIQIKKNDDVVVLPFILMHFASVVCSTKLGIKESGYILVLPLLWTSLWSKTFDKVFLFLVISILEVMALIVLSYV